MNSHNMKLYSVYYTQIQETFSERYIVINGRHKLPTLYILWKLVTCPVIAVGDHGLLLYHCETL